MVVMVSSYEPNVVPQIRFLWANQWKVIFNDPIYSQLIREIPIGIEALRYIGINTGPTYVDGSGRSVALVECEVFITGRRKWMLKTRS